MNVTDFVAESIYPFNEVGKKEMVEMNDTKESFLKRKPLYEEAIRRRVCSKCIDFGEDGICHAQDSEECAIFRLLLLERHR